MGKAFQQQLQAKIAEVGVDRVRAFVNPAGFEPAYRQHIDDTLADLGVEIVATRADANFVLDGEAEPQLSDRQIVAYLEKGHAQMTFAGALS